MGEFRLIRTARLAVDAHRLLGDSRCLCTLYRGDVEQAQFWGRISNIGRQTTGLERQRLPSNVTGSLSVLKVPPGAPQLQHEDEIRTNGTRWRIIHVRRIYGQIAIVSNIQ